MPWLSNAIIGGSACPDASPMKRSPTTIGTPVTWQSDYLTGVESVAYAYQVGARSIAAVRYPAAQAAPGLASTKSLRSYPLAERDSLLRRDRATRSRVCLRLRSHSMQSGNVPKRPPPLAYKLPRPHLYQEPTAPTH